MDNPQTPAQIEFLNRLAALFPEVAEVIHAQRRKESARIFAFAEMNQLTKWLGSTQARSRGSEPAAERAKGLVRDFLEQLETHFEIGDVALENLIAVGFLMSLGRYEEFPAIRALLPPRMSAWYARELDPGGELNKPNPPAMVAFLNHLATRIPEAARVIHAGRQERGRILPYIEVEELIPWLGSMQARTRDSGAAGDRAMVVVREFLDELESQFEVGDPDIDNLIAVGFLEGLSSIEGEFPALRALLPPRMSAWFARYLEEET